MKKVFALTSIFVLLDQIIKWFICAKIPFSSSISVIPDFFGITHVRNIGAAWSLFEGNRWFLILTTVAALIIIYYVFLKEKKFNKLEMVTYAALLGGIIGNLMDRVFRGYVVDYLEFHIFGYNYPIFNLADTLIVVSVICIIICLLKGDENGKYNRSRK